MQILPSTRKMISSLSHPVEKWRSVKYLWNPMQELDRLKEIPTIRTALAEKEQFFTGAHLNSSHLKIASLISYGRSLEVQKIFGSTHYVFTHGQSTVLFAIQHLFNKILLSNTQDAISSPFEIKTLRHPVAFIHTERNYYISDPDRKLYDLAYFKSRCGHPRNSSMHDGEVQDVLISADAHLASEESGESALYYFNLMNACFFHKFYEKLYKPLVERTLSFHMPGQKMVKRAVTKMDELHCDYWERQGGILNVICIPKEKFHQVGYISLAYGRDFPTGKNLEPTRLLEKMQSGRAVSYRVERDGNRVANSEDLAQIRLLLPKLLVEPNTFTFMFPTLPDCELHLLLDRIKNITTPP